MQLHIPDFLLLIFYSLFFIFQQRNQNICISINGAWKIGQFLFYKDSRSSGALRSPLITAAVFQTTVWGGIGRFSY
jgi:hypothetical protein